jgi:hypothetical protein
MATMRAEFLGQSLSAAATPSVSNAARPAASLKVVSLFNFGKKKAAAAAAPVKKAAKTVQKSASKAASKVNKPDNEELAKWYGTYLSIYLSIYIDRFPPPFFFLKSLNYSYVA